MRPNSGGVLETLYEQFIRGPYWYLKLRSHPRMERTIADRDVAFVLEKPGHRQYHEFESEAQVIRDVVSELRQGDVFYDIGANIGLYSCVVSTVLEETDVVAFEPSPPAFSKLDKNARLNRAPFRRYQLAVSDADARTTLAVDTDDTYARMSTLEPQGGTTAHDRTEVTMRRLDSLVGDEQLPEPTVAKIDVEGAEYDVVRGMGDVLDGVRLLYCEIHHPVLSNFGTTARELRDYLNSAGFEVERLYRRDENEFVKATRSV